MSVRAISKTLPEVFLDTCLVPTKKAAAKKADDFFPGTSPINGNAQKIAENIAEKKKKAEEAENVGNLVGNIINYFG